MGAQSSKLEWGLSVREWIQLNGKSTVLACEGVGRREHLRPISKYGILVRNSRHLNETLHLQF